MYNSIYRTDMKTVMWTNSILRKNENNKNSDYPKKGNAD